MAVRKALIKDALSNWIDLNKAISDFTEEEVQYALELELAREEVRETFVDRLRQRLRGIKIGEIREEIK